MKTERRIVIVAIERNQDRLHTCGCDQTDAANRKRRQHAGTRGHILVSSELPIFGGGFLEAVQLPCTRKRYEDSEVTEKFGVSDGI